jgi:hypothetical protein
LHDRRYGNAEKGIVPLPGHEWDRQMLCLTSPESERFFDPEALRATLVRGRGLVPPQQLEPASRNGDTVIVGVDLASGEGGDRTAMFVERFHQDGRREAVHIRAGRWAQMEMLRQMLDVHRRYVPNCWCVESNGIQRMITTASRDSTIMAAAGAIPDDLRTMRVMATVTTGAAKHDPILGIKGMSMDFEAGKWIVPDVPEMREWIGECESWTPDSHTGDLLSASYQAEMGMRMMRRPRVVV